ncbi:MAG: adenosylmethionine decarboxylase [Bacteroidota bacterium]|jgi:S-adenosylmethionine decarboxylase
MWVFLYICYYYYQMYQPGTHIIAELKTNNIALLTQFAAIKQFVDQQIAHFSLTNLGEVYHNFSPAGYTGVVCLSESHISFHSWPEHGRLHMDVYLSNYSRNNDQTAHLLFDNMVRFFDAEIIQQQTLLR